MHRPGVELATFRSRVRRPNHYTTEALVAVETTQNIPKPNPHQNTNTLLGPALTDIALTHIALSFIALLVYKITKLQINAYTERCHKRPFRAS